MKYLVAFFGLISVSSLVLAWLAISALSKFESNEKHLIWRTANIESELETLKTRERYSGLVDFASTSVQEITGDLYLVQASQEKHLTGLRFKGRVINGSALDREDVRLSLKLAQQSEVEKQFTINKISSGNSTGFSVYIPDIDAKGSRFVQLKLDSSSVLFSSK